MPVFGLFRSAAVDKVLQVGLVEADDVCHDFIRI